MIFLGVLVIAQIYTARKVTDSIEKAEISGRIAHELSVLNMLTQDYLLLKTERAKTQWEITYNALENLIEHNFDPHKNIGHDHTKQEELIFQKLHADHQFIGEQFARIIQPGISQDMLKKLGFQVVVRSQDMAHSAFGSSDASTKAVMHAQRVNRDLNLVLLSAMLFLVLLGFYFFVFPAITSLRKLSKGSELVGKGNFSHHIDVPSRDEVGELVVSFNLMSDNLKKTTAEREKLISELQEALSEIKTLSGLIPICSHCKKIRDNKGHWQQLEQYIHEHSDAHFSHGICKECAKKHYPDFDIYED